jgi:hypothetical protein
MVDRVCIELDLLVEEYIELPAVTIYVGFETITCAYYQPHTKSQRSKLLVDCDLRLQHYNTRAPPAVYCCTTAQLVQQPTNEPAP